MTASPASDQASNRDKITHSSRTRLRMVSQDMRPQSIAWKRGRRRYGSEASPHILAVHDDVGAMTTSPVEVPRQAVAGDRRFGFVRQLVATEVVLTVAEVVLVVVPTLALGARSLRASGESFRVAAMLAALMIVGWVRAADLLRPTIATRDAKRSGRALDEAEISATDRAIRHAPFEVAATRWLLWSFTVVYVAVRLATRGLLAWPSAVGRACIGALHAGGMAERGAAPVGGRPAHRPPPAPPPSPPLRALLRRRRAPAAVQRPRPCVSRRGGRDSRGAGAALRAGRHA